MKAWSVALELVCLNKTLEVGAQRCSCTDAWLIKEGAPAGMARARFVIAQERPLPTPSYRPTPLYSLRRTRQQAHDIPSHLLVNLDRHSVAAPPNLPRLAHDVLPTLFGS